MVGTWIAVLILFSTGIIISYYGLWYGMLLFPGMMLLFYLLWPRWGREIIAAALVVGLGFAYFQIRELDEMVNPGIAGQRVISGVIADYPVQKADRTSFLIETAENSSHLKYIQVYCDFPAELHRGEQVTLRGILEVPDKPGNPGEFDYYKYLLHQRVFYIMSVELEADIKQIIPVPGISRQLNSYRNRIEETVYDTLPESEAEIFLGMLLGEKENIDADRYEMFQQIGIVHIFAVSGLHIGFLVLFFSYAASLAALSRRNRYFAVMFCMIIYGSLIGWPISVQRAVIMAALALLAQYQGREGGLGNSLGLAGMIIVLLDPYALFTTSFQLSFMATWGLVCLYPAIKSSFQYKNRVWDIILIPLCAQLAVVPLLAYYFNLFSPAGLISNIMISYLAGGIVISGAAALLLVFLPPLAALFLYPSGYMIEILQGLADFISQIPGSYLWVKTPGLAVIASYYLLLLMLLAALYYSWPRRWIWSPSILVIISLIVICLPPSLYKYGTMEIVFLDVGQGDSIFIKTPRGKFIMLDGGGSHFYSVGQKKVIPYLHHRGVREIFMLINSHPDSDHLMGLLEIAEQIPFRYAVIPTALLDAGEYDELKRIASARGAVVLGAAAGQQIHIDEEGLQMEVLSPPAGIESSDYNKLSLVLRCEYGDFSLLLPGDLDKEGLEDITPSGSTNPTLLVKVPHHGSRGSLSEGFYQGFDPYAAVISVGKNNIYGHPNQEVLDCLEKQGIMILRTDQNGAVSFESDGQSMEINCFRK
ncbi:late competence protein comec, dna transport [hydrocarbon metagenome]|uniref:Late competence protein comec, dna transport n=1 Tax=hydrocarbon metagenome TaxID=938273 RepID=A0A0W8E6J3_9ZZZZ